MTRTILLLFIYLVGAFNNVSALSGDADRWHPTGKIILLTFEVFLKYVLQELIILFSALYVYYRQGFPQTPCPEAFLLMEEQKFWYLNPCIVFFIFFSQGLFETIPHFQVHIGLPCHCGVPMDKWPYAFKIFIFPEIHSQIKLLLDKPVHQPSLIIVFQNIQGFSPLYFQPDHDTSKLW